MTPSSQRPRFHISYDTALAQARAATLGVTRDHQGWRFEATTTRGLPVLHTGLGYHEALGARSHTIAAMAFELMTGACLPPDCPVGKGDARVRLDAMLNRYHPNWQTPGIPWRPIERTTPCA